MANITFPNNVFPLGAHVYREPHQDQEELLADLDILAKLGFNMIKIQESWAIDEPREGEIDLSRIERVIARAGELNMGVYLGLTMEQAPAWMYRKYPDCFFVYADGSQHNDPTQYCLPSDGKPGPCWDHPGARQAAENFIASLTSKLSRFENIWVWNVWQEIGFWPNPGGILEFCYCPHTLAGFRTWLQSQYATLDALNATWQTAFREWEEVDPPRRHAFVPPFIDWRYFIENVYLTEVLKWKAQVIRDNDPLNRPVFSHVGGPKISSGAEWRWGRATDFFGVSNYPDWGICTPAEDDRHNRSDRMTTYVNEIRNGLMLNSDYCRSAGGLDSTYWGAEFQGGPIGTHLHLGRVPDASDIRRWMLAGLASGMNAISFWNHRAERFWSECNGFGLLDPQGDTTERIEAAAAIGNAINESPEVFSIGHPQKADVAILINENLYNFCQATHNEASLHLSNSIRGHYCRLWDMGVAADFVEADYVPQELDGYKVAILTTPLALDTEYFAKLKDFVAGGGMLISDACPGRFEKYGMCPRQQMVAGGEELFGAKHLDYRNVREPVDQDQSLWTPPERGWGEFLDAMILDGVGEFAGARLRVNAILQTLTPTTATPILTTGDDVAGTINKFGDGHAVLLGTLSGHGGITYRLDEPELLFEKLLDMAGVKPDRTGVLLRRKRVLGDTEAWMFINPTGEEVTETIPLEGMQLVRDITADSVVSAANDELQIRVPAGNLSCIVVKR